MAAGKRKTSSDTTYPMQRKKSPSKPGSHKKKQTTAEDSATHTPELPLTTAVREKSEPTPPTSKPTHEAPVTATSVPPRYFLQLEKGNLLTYFIAGLLYPPGWDTTTNGRRAQRATDIQSRTPDQLLLTPSFTQDADDKQVLAEIVLSPAECSALQPVGEGFLMQDALPVSRVVRIWTKNEDTADNLLSSARSYSDILFPSSLLSPTPCDFPPPRPAPDPSGGANTNTTPEMQAKKAKYDRTLGMLAYMRNTERYFTQQTHRYRDLAANYLATLSRLNTEIQPLEPSPESAKAADFYIELLSGRPRDPFFASLLEVITSDGGFDKATVQEIVAAYGQRHDEQTAKAANAAFDELFDDNFKVCVQHLQAHSKLWNLTVLAVLYRFRKKDGENKIIVKQIFPSVIADPKKAEIILALLGMYYGYTSLPKDEEVSSLDRDLAAFIGPSHPIKFDIESLLDRHVIETAYRFTFQVTKTSDGFDYLPKETASTARRETIEPSSPRLRAKTFTLMGTPIRVVEVVDPVESLINLIRETYPKNRSTGYLAFFAAARWPMAIIRLNFTREKGLDLDVDTEEVIRTLHTLKPAELDEAKSCVELDRSLTNRGNRG